MTNLTDSQKCVLVEALDKGGLFAYESVPESMRVHFDEFSRIGLIRMIFVSADAEYQLTDAGTLLAQAYKDQERSRYD